VKGGSDHVAVLPRLLGAPSRRRFSTSMAEAKIFNQKQNWKFNLQEMVSC